MAKWSLRSYCEECKEMMYENGKCEACVSKQQWDPLLRCHYSENKIESITYIKQVLGKEGFVAYCRGCVMYHNHKAYSKGNATEDMAKAEQYLKWANETLKEIHK
tara:strand:+ start:1120 stop:1434 length:315 start_codon:yes stop_codon:yes gene_type:complete